MSYYARVSATLFPDGKRLNKVLDPYKERIAKGQKANITSAELQSKAGVNILASTHLVRFADDFIVTTNSRIAMDNALRGIKEFLSIRGLTLNEEKSQIMK